MLSSMSEYRFYQSYRIAIEEADDIRFLVEKEDDSGNFVYIDDGKLVDVSVTGLGFKTKERISSEDELRVSLHFKGFSLDLKSTVVRAFSDSHNEELIIYGVEFEEEDFGDLKKFIEAFVHSFSHERLRECLSKSALKERYTSSNEGMEMFSLLLSIFKDMTNFGRREDFINGVLQDVVRNVHGSRASLFLINTEENELQSIAAFGVPKEDLKFDYRLGVPGAVFTTGIPLNIDFRKNTSRIKPDDPEHRFGVEPKSVLSYPFHNREEKVVGVIMILNKRSFERFNSEDEITLKVLSLVLSAIFHDYDPISEKSTIRRFSPPFNREFVLIGKSQVMKGVRESIIKVKNLETPLLVNGEYGSGKSLLSRIIHKEGPRGPKSYECVTCGGKEEDAIWEELFGKGDLGGKLANSHGGTLVLQEICFLPIPHQKKLVEVLSQKTIEGSTVALDVRLHTTSSKDLEGMVNNGEFNKDLYEFLAQTPIEMPSLRKRGKDIEELISYFLKNECKKQGLLEKTMSPKILGKLKDYDWPGNVKELGNCISRMVTYNPKSHTISKLPDQALPLYDQTKSTYQVFGDIPFASDYSIPLKDRMALIERKLIFAEIKRNGNNKSKAAKAMGISREALRKKLLQADKIIESLETKNVVPISPNTLISSDDKEAA
ncbi:MAG: sigma 54-interacting transcriptional regulator [Bacteriovoracaceae bacterium]|jgi:two-component system, NtrC family, response regulator HydG|nr:sigma 54-interacting transcriptional regulator [Bacteriovoracaceae bacterium]